MHNNNRSASSNMRTATLRQKLQIKPVISVRVYWPRANQSCPWPNNARCLWGQAVVNIYRSLVWLDQGKWGATPIPLTVWVDALPPGCEAVQGRNHPAVRQFKEETTRLWGSSRKKPPGCEAVQGRNHPALRQFKEETTRLRGSSRKKPPDSEAEQGRYHTALRQFKEETTRLWSSSRKKPPGSEAVQRRHHPAPR